MKPVCSDADFVRLFEAHGAAETARRLRVNVRNVQKRRSILEGRIGRQIRAPHYQNTNTRHAEDHPGRISADIKDGVVLVGSDFHLWPGDRSTAFRAFVKFCKELKPQIVVANGDVLDFPQVSRHPPIGHQHLPSVEEEIEYAQEMMGDIEKAAFKARKIWTLGNHDSRFETRLATIAPEFARLHGFSLKNYFPEWEPCWSVWVNDCVIKHRWKGGQGATRANALNAGKSMVTGHLHSLKVTPLTDYNGTRYGVDTGCIADPKSRQFLDYTEDAPLDWRSGFAVLTFHRGELLPPELVQVWDENHVTWRGQIVKV